jgi:hypothetical protein
MKQAAHILLDAICLIALTLRLLLYISMYPIQMAMDLCAGEDPYTR